MAALLKNNIFVCEGHWETVNGQETWAPEHQTPYLNPAIIHTIKTAWFGSGRTLGNHHQQVYTSSLPSNRDEKEFPIPLVALATTNVHAALSSWKAGVSPGRGPLFKGELFGTTYKTFCTSLGNFKATKPQLFHHIMNMLYTSVCGAQVDVNDPGLEEDPLAVLDLDEI